MTYEGEIPKSLIFMHHNQLILNVLIINEKLRYMRKMWGDFIASCLNRVA